MQATKVAILAAYQLAYSHGQGVKSALLEGKRAAFHHLQWLLADKKVASEILAVLAGSTSPTSLPSTPGEWSAGRLLYEVHTVVDAINNLPPVGEFTSRSPAAGCLLHTLVGHRGPVENLALRDGLLISGSLDETIKVWDPVTGACLRTLVEHEGDMTAVAAGGGMVYSVSWG